MDGNMKPDIFERRLFLSHGLKITGVLLGGSLFSLTSVRRVHSALEGVGVIGSYPFAPHYTMVLRQHKCTGCRQCVQACAGANYVPAYGYRIRVLQRYGGENEPEFMPVLCNQCNRPPCVKVCPTKATYKDKTNGIVRMDHKLCIGCKACMTACPYNARYFNNATKAVDKCDFCFQARLSKDSTIPACAEVCPTGVFAFGDLNDQTSEVYSLVHQPNRTVYVQRPERGTMPNIFYLKD
jgi:protein NrfC